MWIGVRAPSPITDRAEFTATFRPRWIRHVLFDWDGTLSFVRSGWGEIMVDVFVSALPEVAGETRDKRRGDAWDEIMRLNGRPSIHQMTRLAELVRARGGSAPNGMAYQAEFQRRLAHHIFNRLDAVRRGA